MSKLDPAHSSIGFTDHDATITLTDDLAAHTAQGTVRTASVDTRNEDRDAHVRDQHID